MRLTKMGSANWTESLRHGARRIRKNNHLNFFPLKEVITSYSREDMRGDWRAGLNVALLAFPQGMAYAAIAGLPIQYGIFGSAIAALLGPILSGSRFIILGPTNATSVLIFASLLGLGVTDVSAKVGLVPVIVLLSGIFLILGAFLKVANLIQYISRSVVTGYITAAAIYIIINQLKKVLGYDFTLPEGSTFLDVIWLTLTHIPETQWPVFVLSLLTALTLYFLNKYWKGLPNVAITLLLMSIVGAGWGHLLEGLGLADAIQTHRAVNAADWTLIFPSLRPDLISNLASTALVVAFLSVLEGTSIGKSLASRAGKKLDANQEMLGMGLANIGCAFYQGMPASGSLTRSQLNWSSGGRTPFSSIYSGLIVAAGAYILGPYTRFIPVNVLGVLVIGIGLSLINRHVLRVVWNATKSDRVVFLTTFIAALLIRLDFAIILGAGVSILLFLRKAAQPELIEYSQDELEGAQAEAGSNPEVSIVHVEGDLFFGASELFRDQMRRVCEKPNLKVVILKLRNARHLDATSVLALEELNRYTKENDRHLLISEVRKDAIRIFKNSGLIDLIGRDNIFPDQASNPTLSTAKAIRRAMKILGGQEADVKIFLGGNREAKNQPET